MRANFDQALAAVLAHEGGYVNHPRDPGGATNRGVTQSVYDDWRAKNILSKQSVRVISPAEVMAIYKRQYWDAVRGDELPAGVDYCVFDFAVNSGVKRAARYLQRAASVTDDGQIGPATMRAIAMLDAGELVDAICGARLAFLKSLSTFDTFGRGWSSRVAEVRAKSKVLTA